MLRASKRGEGGAVVDAEDDAEASLNTVTSKDTEGAVDAVEEELCVAECVELEVAELVAEDVAEADTEATLDIEASEDEVGTGDADETELLVDEGVELEVAKLVAEDVREAVSEGSEVADVVGLNPRKLVAWVKVGDLQNTFQIQ